MTDPQPAPVLPAGFEPLPMRYAHSFIAHMGPLYIRREASGPCIAARLQPHQCNPFGEVHGGFLAALADFVCAYTMLCGPDPTPSVVTIQLSSQMIGSARLGDWLEGRGTLRRKGRTIAHVGCAFTCGDALVAHSDAVFRVLSADRSAERHARRGDATG